MKIFFITLSQKLLLNLVEINASCIIKVLYFKLNLFDYLILNKVELIKKGLFLFKNNMTNVIVTSFYNCLPNGPNGPHEQWKNVCIHFAQIFIFIFIHTHKKKHRKLYPPTLICIFFVHNSAICKVLFITAKFLII